MFVAVPFLQCIADRVCESADLPRFRQLDVVARSLPVGGHQEDCFGLIDREIDDANSAALASAGLAVRPANLAERASRTKGSVCSSAFALTITMLLLEAKLLLNV